MKLLVVLLVSTLAYGSSYGQITGRDIRRIGKVGIGNLYDEISDQIVPQKTAPVNGTWLLFTNAATPDTYLDILPITSVSGYLDHIVIWKFKVVLAKLEDPNLAEATLTEAYGEPISRTEDGEALQVTYGVDRYHVVLTTGLNLKEDTILIESSRD